MRTRATRVEFVDGKEVCYVPLGRGSNSAEATIYKEDYDLLMKLGLSGNWLQTQQGYVTAASGRINPPARLQVGRVLMDAKPGTQVRCLDGNPLNLRRDNLVLAKGGFSLRRDREFIRK